MASIWLLAGLFAVQAETCEGAANATSTTIRKLPDGNLNVGYCNWRQCDDKIIRAAEQGINVVIWFSINLATDDDGNQIIDGHLPDFDCVGRIVKELRDKNLPTTHLISVGGWNAPLPDTKYSGAEWWRYFERWNKEVVARPELGWHGFEGLDWVSK